MPEVYLRPNYQRPTSQLKQFSFGGVSMPYTEITRDFEFRHHIHEYPHSHGGAVEKLGRKLWAFDVQTVFYANTTAPQYEKLWPRGLHDFLKLIEQGSTQDLILPQVGSPIRAICVNGKFVLSSRNTLGEKATLKFVEDDEKARTIESAIAVKADRIETAQSEVVAKAGLLPPAKVNLLDGLLRAANDVLAYRDQFELYTNLLEAKCMSVISMCKQLVDAEEELRHPDRWPLTNAIHELWAQTQAILSDQQQIGNVTRVFTVRADSSLSQVAFQIYKSTARSADLMRLNVIEDPLLIPAGTKIRYYAEAA